MVDGFVEWLSGVIFSSAFLCFVAFLMRNAISRFMTKTIELRFEKSIEAYKSEKRDNEKELEQIRNFISLARKERDSALQVKKLEAAESLMRVRQFLFGFNMIVEFLKVIKIDEALKQGNDPKFIDFINTLSAPFDIDAKLKEYGKFDRTLHGLYLSDKVLNVFEVYESIIIYAVSVMKFLSIPLSNKPEMIDLSSVSKKIISMAPASKEGFDKFGSGYSLYWVNHFYTETLKQIRVELFGDHNFNADSELATKVAIDSRNAQMQVRESLRASGASDEIIRSNT